ncbi:STM4504/CBY_0614 family protein [Leptospira adleri]|uniref:Abortive infection protein-like C-terminal domain-containing protein n=1 Tax=Leptospira adleri TaxID=2023186 RepID=A0ABX4NS63_9LEPT|nr:hypothetical protein [Leptospira adleri]PJZ59681.1 hypothetical protein CH376_22435 [Leptospira adleri]
MYNIFSKRQKQMRGEVPDIYRYDVLPETLRVQFIHIINDVLKSIGGEEERYQVRELLEDVHRILLKEYGVFFLISSHQSPIDDYLNFILREKNVERVLDGIELFGKALSLVKDNLYYPGKITSSEAIKEVNSRFREAGIGFKIEDGIIVKIDSELLHKETVQDTLKLIHGKEYLNINNEYLSAHEHFRHGRYSEAIADSLKAFESSLKLACEKRKISYDKKDTSKRLIDLLFQNTFFPSYMQTYIGSLRAILESGIPTIRNRTSGHGKGVGTDPEALATESLSNFILNITGSVIKFIIKSI